MIQIVHVECISMLPGKGYTTLRIFVTPILKKLPKKKKKLETETNHQSDPQPLNEAISVYYLCTAKNCFILSLHTDLEWLRSFILYLIHVLIKEYC